METTPSPELPTKLQQPTAYSLVRCLGVGGMGSVYEAVQHGAVSFTKRVAIKRIHPEVVKRPEFLQNFVGEAKLVAQLVHTNIVQTYQLGENEGTPFIVMEYIDGTDLLQLLAAHASRDFRLPISIAVFIASRVCRGLSYAHIKRGMMGEPLGIVHRDISPQNIMISRDGDVKITDFGMAKALNLMLDGEGEVIMGKVRYMSPEQARGEKTDGRSDLFSLGVVLSEMLVGINVFAAGKSTEEKERILNLEIPDFRALSPDLDPKLCDILQRALARNVSERYDGANGMLVDLERFLYSGGYGPTSETLAEYAKEYLPPEKNGVISLGNPSRLTATEAPRATRK